MTRAKSKTKSRRGSKPGERRGGRQKGTPNKVTAGARALIVEFMDNNMDNAQELFDRLSKKNPGKALDILQRMAEYVAPKLGRTEHTVPPGTGAFPVAVAHADLSDEDGRQAYQRMIKRPK